MPSKRDDRGRAMSPFSGHVDPEVLALTRQVQGLVEQAKTLVTSIDDTVVELNDYREAKRQRLEAARAKWTRTQEKDGH